MTSTLRDRVKAAFVAAGVTWPADDSKAIPLGGAALQCQTDHTAGLVCDVMKDKPDLMVRNAKLMVLLCGAAGWDETAANLWIAGELRAALRKERTSVRITAGCRFTLAVDHPPRLVVFKVEELGP